MELLQLRYFLALAEKENLTKTANDLFISPSSLSATISKLEKELGTQLFDRSGRKIRLNKSGKDFYNYIQPGLAEIDMGVSLVRGDSSVFVMTDSPAVWPLLFSNFMSAEPDIIVNSRYVRRSACRPGMLLDKYDFLLSSVPLPDNFNHLQMRKLSACNLCLAVAKDGPLGNLDSVPLRSLKNADFLFPSYGYSYYDLYWNTCTKCGFEPKIVGTCGFTIRMKLVSSGHGISFVDSTTAESNLYSNISFLQLPDVEQVHPLAIHWSPDRKLSDAAKKFLQFATLFFQDSQDYS